MSRARRRLSFKLARYSHVLRYLFYHKLLFRITNTKFDISYCVFRESFLGDQYGIREFLRELGSSKGIFFLDMGRNHGFVFYYTMYYIMKSNFQVSSIRYFGIDPAPLKFVYFNFHDYLKKRGIKIEYYLIDRALVFNGERMVMLKYGEHNYGNFNVSGSNYDRGKRIGQPKFEYVEVAVETVQFSSVKKLIQENIESDTIIVKIDCKNRTEAMFFDVLAMMRDRDAPYLVSCERDGSSGRDVSEYQRPGANVLNASNAVDFRATDRTGT